MKINVKIPKKINIGGIKTGTPPYTLPIASKDVLGGIKVGKNLTIEEDGTLNAQASGSGYEPNIMTIKNVGKQTWTKGTYTQLILELLSSIGDKLTYTTDGIKIGSGVTRVKISGYATIMSSEPGPIHFKIVKNVHDNANTIGWLIDRVDLNYGQTTVTYPSSIVSVTEGDIIYMYAYTTGIGQVGADNGTVSQANLTVEVVK